MNCEGWSNEGRQGRLSNRQQDGSHVVALVWPFGSALGQRDRSRVVAIRLVSNSWSLSPLNFSLSHLSKKKKKFVHLFFHLDWVYILLDLHFCFLIFTWVGLIVHDFGKGPSYKVRGAQVCIYIHIYFLYIKN